VMGHMKSVGEHGAECSALTDAKRR
jgi:hypothetical protein